MAEGQAVHAADADDPAEFLNRLEDLYQERDRARPS